MDNTNIGMVKHGESNQETWERQVQLQSDRHEVEILDVTRGSLVQAEMGSKMETWWMFTAENVKIIFGTCK